MTGVGGPAQRSARLELDSARSVVARLDGGRGGEDQAADLVEIWSALEAALRSLIGSNVLSGQPLIREARSRQLINFDQANALADFQAVRDRLEDTNYRPSESDNDSARRAFLKLEAALTETDTGAARPSSSSAPAVKTMPIVEASEPVKVVSPPRRVPIWAWLTGAIVAVGVTLILVFRPWSGGDSALQQGITAYRAGQREAAVSHFTRAAREPSTEVLGHVYLARMAREVGNFTLASQELQLALQKEPENATALSEMGANLLAQGNYELARRFYVRAVQADPTEKKYQGYLGCALMRLNRVQEAGTFMNRAGPGPWTNCIPSTTQGQAGGQVVPPGSIPP